MDDKAQSVSMKITQICTAGSLGGLELYFATCCRQLKQRGHDVKAVVLQDSMLHQLLKDEIDCVVVSRKLFADFKVVKSFLRKFEPDALHVHHKTDLLLAALLKHFSGVKYHYVHTRHMDMPGKKKNLYHRFIYNSLDLVITITDRLKNQFVQNTTLSSSKVVRLYLGVPNVESIPGRHKEIGLNSDSFNIGVIARIDRKKEQHVLIEAIKLMEFKSDNLEVHLIGGSTDDVYLEELQDLIRKYELTNVRIHGFISNPQELISCFDTVVLTTSNETFGLALPEAMRCEVPVIGANGGGVPEIIDHNQTGLLFSPGNPESLADQIERLMENDLFRRELAKNGKLKADRMFEINRHFESLETLLDKKCD